MQVSANCAKPFRRRLAVVCYGRQDFKRRIEYRFKVRVDRNAHRSRWSGFRNEELLPTNSLCVRASVGSDIVRRSTSRLAASSLQPVNSRARLTFLPPILPLWLSTIDAISSCGWVSSIWRERESERERETEVDTRPVDSVPFRATHVATGPTSSACRY